MPLLAHNKSLIAQSNKLISSRRNLTLAEKRIMLLMIAQIEQHDEEFKTYRMSIKDFVEAIGTKSKNEYERVKEITEKMLSRVFKIYEQDGLLQVGLLSSVKYYDKKGYVDICFDPKLKPYLIQLKEQFTLFNIKHILSLQSFYSIRLYELLKQHEQITNRVFYIDELKDILGVKDKYEKYGHFKNKIILPAQKSLKEKCDLHFSFKEIKESRQITKIKFFIKSNDKKPKLPKIDTSGLSKDSIDKLMYRGFSKHKAVEYVKTKKEDFLLDVIAYADEQAAKDNIKTNKAMFMKYFLNGNTPPYSPEEKGIRESEEIDRFYKNFIAENEKKLDSLIKSTTRDERDAFVNSLKGHKREMANISARCQNQYFREHIAEQKGIDSSEEAFKAWILKTKGWVVEKQSWGSSQSWVVKERQEKLF